MKTLRSILVFTSLVAMFLAAIWVIGEGSKIDSENKRQKQERYAETIHESGRLAGLAGAPAESNRWLHVSGGWLGDKTAESATWLKGWSEGTIERHKQ